MADKKWKRSPAASHEALRAGCIKGHESASCTWLNLVLVGVTLTACSGGGGGGGGSSQPPITISGRITYDFVPFSANGTGLDYGLTEARAAREIAVQVVQATNQSVLAETTTDTNGQYSTSVPANSSVFVRARAVSRSAGTPARPASWDLRVLNNTNGNALYVLDGAVFNTGMANQTRDLRAASGWTGGGYTASRAAAPFAILDTLYAATQFVITHGDAAVALSALSAYWSPQNRSSDDWDPAVGRIDTTAYRSGFISGSPPGIYVLGAADLDSDEYDAHVVAHEFHHFLEDAVSRTDSPGLDHAQNERLDMRLAFSEGFSNAFSAMALDDPIYRDSFGMQQRDDFRISMEDAAAMNNGWFNEASVHAIVWDLFDDANEPHDIVALGYGPIYGVFREELRNDTPLNAVFPFIAALKQRPGAQQSGIDAVVAVEGIVAETIEPYAGTETNSGVALTSRDLVLPVYTEITPDGSPVRLCGAPAITDPDGMRVEGVYNKLGNRRFLRFSVPSSRAIDIRVTCNGSDPTCMGNPQPDPDLVLWRGRDLEISDSATPFTEQLQTNAVAGDYALEIYEYSHIDLAATVRRGQTCMTVTITG